jgi:hydrogenase nickel incorporation protein HypB
MTEHVVLKQNVLSENDRLASTLRDRFAAHGILTLNLVSSPGSGKTSLLEKTIAALGAEYRLAVVAGDVQTDNDARRITAAGTANVVPIVTGGKCHLDAQMVTDAIVDIDLSGIDMLFIENVGNLVCPSSYDLGEDMKVVLLSTTEGDDKPLKYPGMFRRSGLMIVNKLDLLGLSDFDMRRVREAALSINGDLTILEIACRTNVGLEHWYAWLREHAKAKRAGATRPRADTR